MHEVIHDHEYNDVHTETCYLYQYAQTPLLLSTPIVIITATYNYEPIVSSSKFPVYTLLIQNKSRSPPTV